jgi:hypothetical protein
MLETDDWKLENAEEPNFHVVATLRSVTDSHPRERVHSSLHFGVAVL